MNYIYKSCFTLYGMYRILNISIILSYSFYLKNENDIISNIYYLSIPNNFILSKKEKKIMNNNSSNLL